MKKEKIKPKFESLEDFKARGGEIKIVDFSNAYGPYATFGRDIRNTAKVKTQKQIEKEKAKMQFIINRKKFNENKSN